MQKSFNTFTYVLMLLLSLEEFAPLIIREHDHCCPPLNLLFFIMIFYNFLKVYTNKNVEVSQQFLFETEIVASLYYHQSGKDI